MSEVACSSCMLFALSALGTGGHDYRLPFHLLLPDSEGHRENITNLLVGVLNLRKSCLGRKLTRGEQPLLRRKNCPHDFDLSTLSWQAMVALWHANTQTRSAATAYRNWMRNKPTSSGSWNLQLSKMFRKFVHRFEKIVAAAPFSNMFKYARTRTQTHADTRTHTHTHAHTRLKWDPW